MSTATATRVRRTDEQMIADLEARISGLKTRATQKKAKRSPSIGFTLKAVKSIDAAMAAQQAAESSRVQGRAGTEGRVADVGSPPGVERRTGPSRRSADRRLRR